MERIEGAPTGDTIAALATPPGRAGIGVIRVSGPRARAVCEGLTGVAAPRPRQASFRRFLDRTGDVLDEGIVVLFQAPASFTGEDVLEIHAHGSPVVLGALLDRVVALGVRGARPGEFSQRAFLNGKYDLAQLEAVADLVSSASIQAARSAQRVLQGEFSRSIARLSSKIEELRVLTEAALDFPEEDDVDVVGDRRLRGRLHELVESIRAIETRAVHGARLHDGIELVIAGRPNAGKSSLLNRLSQTDEAIVSDTAGTTRDIVKSEVLLDGIPLRVLDTAGLGAPGDPVEEEGVRRAWRAMDGADVVLLLVDATAGAGVAEEEVRRRLADGADVLTVFNKADLIAHRRATGVDAWVSAKTGEGLAGLRTLIKRTIGVGDSGEDAFAARRRHLEALEQAREALLRALEHLCPEGAVARTELAAEGLREAREALGAIVGDYATEELLGDIFAGFCVGK